MEDHTDKPSPLDYTPAKFGELTAANVTRLFGKCLSTDADPTADNTRVIGVRTIALFDRGALQEHEREIREVLEQVDMQFKEVGGRGHWFPYLRFLPGTIPSDPTDTDTPGWGEHRHAEWLVMLGLAVGKVQWLAPRDQWTTIFPDGVPYLMVCRESWQIVPVPAPLVPLPTNVGIVPWIVNQAKRIITPNQHKIRQTIVKRKPSNKKKYGKS